MEKQYDFVLLLKYRIDFRINEGGKNIRDKNI